MNAAQIQSLHRATPFLPFLVHTANGRSVTIPHPDFAHFSPTGRFLTVYKPDDSFEIVDVVLVTSIETVAMNGTKPRRRRPR